jgi:phosphonate transport system ATP-binding protein
MTTANGFAKAVRGATGIRFRDARVVYPNGTVGLKGLSLDIRAGEFVVIVGSSGAGKSTLLRAINALNPLTSGTIEVGDVAVPQREGRALKQLRARTGMIFQDFRLVKRLTVMSNVLVGRLAHVPGWRAMLNLWPEHDREIAYRALERVGIAEKAWVKASQLSGGQQQRVGIARALAQEPSIILADEPVASLDPVTSRHVMEDLLRINKELGITTLVNLHFLDLAREFGQRIIGLRQGELVYDGNAAEVSDADFQQIYGREFTEDDLKQRERAR